MQSVPVKSAFKDFAITDVNAVPRRQIVSIDKCTACPTGTAHYAGCIGPERRVRPVGMRGQIIRSAARNPGKYTLGFTAHRAVNRSDARAWFVRHLRIRSYLEHAGYPSLDETVAFMTQYPRYLQG